MFIKCSEGKTIWNEHFQCQNHTVQCGGCYILSEFGRKLEKLYNNFCDEDNLLN